ncbi:YaiI/YqxD family protein [Parvibaculum sp.]|uniref:YaiI/YqxD family protein n=1 Tax=Parvibaculum sp. TaxID=2024848 RepID=UPI002C986743|nr:YaiI/YqxD family protein [Parvibaculum sp.]HUD52038.1 YaiI/YqxD family protein [Parvibaculum sp.]
MEIYVDADACPVKDEVLRVAERHGLQVYVVSNSGMRPSGNPLVRQVVVAQGPDAADDWIAERITASDICVTADIPLASRCLGRGARALRPDGKPFTKESIGMALAMRDLMQQLREAGDVKGTNPAFTRDDRSRFLRELENMIQAIRRGKGL